MLFIAKTLFDLPNESETGFKLSLDTVADPRGEHATPPAGVSYELVNLLFIISGHRKWPHLAITSVL